MSSSVPVVDLRPVRGQTFHDILVAEIARARRRGLTPFLEIGGNSCGVCHAVRKMLDARPLDPHVRATFAGTYIIRAAIEDWPDSRIALGLDSEQSIPVYVALNLAGRGTQVLPVDYWTVRAVTAGDRNALHTFFRVHEAHETRSVGGRARIDVSRSSSSASLAAPSGGRRAGTSGR